MAKRVDTGGGAAQPDARAGARAQLVAVEAALSGMASLPVGGLTAVESAQAEGLRQAAGRLVEIAEEIEAAALTVEGSTGQVRPHPLLREEQALRREIADRLIKLEFRVSQRAQLLRLNALTRDPQPSLPIRPGKKAETCKPEGLQASTN